MVEYYWARVGAFLFIVEFAVIFVWTARYVGGESTIVQAMESMKRRHNQKE